MTSNLTERIQLTVEYRDLVLKHGYPLERLRASLLRWPQGQAIRRVWMERVELEYLIGDMSRSCNHDQTGADSDAVLDLCDHVRVHARCQARNLGCQGALVGIRFPGGDHD